MNNKVKRKLKQLIKNKDFNGLIKMLSNYENYFDINNELFEYSIKVGNKKAARFFYEKILETTLEFKTNSLYVSDFEYIYEEFADKVDFSMETDLFNITDNEEFLSQEARDIFIF